MQPDTEKIVGDYLRAESDITDLVGERVSGKHPRNTSTPWVKLTQIGDTAITSRPLHLYEVRLQFDCYGGDDEATAHEEASEIARTVRQVLSEAPDSTHTGAVISHVSFGPMSRVPDTGFEPDRERFVLDANVFIHEA